MGIIDIFLACDAAIRDGVLIRRANRRDKEFHFQDWFGARLADLGVAYDPPARNSYPDFRLVEGAEGYEVKGLAFPGREADFDSNSQAPSGFHNARTIFYLFGRYPKDPDEDEYPVIDMVVCHGDFLNADHDYVHSNKHVKAFGTYGDIKIRDRKMYVVPTPFALTVGTTGQRTLILPQEAAVDERVEQVGELQRTECAEILVGYEFNLKDNTLSPKRVPNPKAGRVHHFRAYRARGAAGPVVSLRAPPAN